MELNKNVMIEKRNYKETEHSLIREFCSNTSAHGLPNIGRSTSWPNRIFWIVLTFGFTGIMLYFIVQSFRDFFSYPTQTSVSIAFLRSQAFPAFSVCNIAPLRFDLFAEAFVNFTNSINVTNTNDTSTISGAQIPHIRDFIIQKLNRGESVRDMSFSLESMFLSCQYNNLPCHSTNFVPFYSSKYGSCYTINARSKLKERNVVATTHGYGSGSLKLELYTHNHQYVPYITESDAAIVGLLHDNIELPMIDIGGIEFGGGRRHKVSYKKRMYQFLDPPYSDCTKSISPEMNATFQLYPGTDYDYSKAVCYELCTQRYIYETCGCADPLKWAARNVLMAGSKEVINAPLCSSNDACYGLASSTIQNDEKLWNQYCSNCKEACSNVDFTIKTSVSTAPVQERFLELKAKIERLPVPLPKNWLTEWENHIQKNYVMIEIVLETTRVDIFEQNPSISPVDLISNIGGHTGLWIGISFLSLLELVEMVYRLIDLTIRRYRNKNNTHL